MNHLRIVVAFVIVAVWCLSYLIGVLQRDYSAFTATIPLMLIVATFLFVTGISKKNGNGNGNGNGSRRR